MSTYVENVKKHFYNITETSPIEIQSLFNTLEICDKRRAFFVTFDIKCVKKTFVRNDNREIYNIYLKVEYKTFNKPIPQSIIYDFPLPTSILAHVLYVSKKEQT